MEQLKVGKSYRDIGPGQRKNVFLAVAAGCLQTVNGTIPGPEHKKQKRKLMELKEELVRDMLPKIPGVASYNLDLFKDTIMASEKVLGDILKEHGRQAVHVLLNLAGFCMEELPIEAKHRKKYRELFSMWEEAYHRQDVRSGERIFTRIESELQILVAQRGGVML